MKQPRSIYVWSFQFHRLKGLPCNCVFLRREISHRPPQRKFQIRQFYVHEVLKSADVSNLLICHIFSHTALRTWRSFMLETDSRLDVMARLHWATATTITVKHYGSICGFVSLGVERNLRQLIGAIPLVTSQICRWHSMETDLYVIVFSFIFICITCASLSESDGWNMAMINNTMNCLFVYTWCL